MKRGYVDKLSAIIVGVILAIFCVLSFSSVQTISTAYAQGQTAAGEPDQIKTLLLRPAGWIAHWGKPLFKPPGDDSPNQVAYIFEVRGDNIVAKADAIKGWYQVKSCERNVTISSNVIEWINCHGNRNTLRFDPNDHDYPFKGMNSYGDEIWFKAK